eukprot:CAMPEP_0172708262 /NCGR_PEP_ID=MMETSP1074-20121228/50450_1 /TAXON_ID=2916 /ORGANISM="Ceratium fusus, Strain PA161109" /LENGTH=46 /DNA_ID= /DNA_START= /DNA_END= /DNA_ORIENTATION=
MAPVPSMLRLALKYLRIKATAVASKGGAARGFASGTKQFCASVEAA